MLTQEFPVLYGVSSKKVIKQWQVMAIQDSNKAIMRKIYGQMGGKLQTNDKEINGKNIGRSNETTPFEQACKDAESAWTKKHDKNYTEQIPDPKAAPAILLPMLAHPLMKKKKYMKLPGWADRKLNGVRCETTKTSEHSVDMRSRTGKSYNETLGHMVPHLLKMMHVGQTVDGEIYLHGKTLQWISRRVKKIRPDTHLLQYWLYDMIDEHMTFQDRKNILTNQYIRDGGPIRLVNSVVIEFESDIKRYHDIFISEGYEGLVFRNANGPYKCGHRSDDLLKYKEFVDAEFTIIGGKPAEGSQEGCMVFELGVPGSDATFFAKPVGSIDRARAMFDSLPDFIGKQLTVRFSEYSEDGIPTGNTVGRPSDSLLEAVAIRDYE
jgi:DNA ligase 1